MVLLLFGFTFMKDVIFDSVLYFSINLPEHGPASSGPRYSNFQDPAAHQHYDPEPEEPSGNPGQPCTHLQGPLQL